MNLQISSRLAIFALLELAANPERQYSVAEIGAKYRISNHHLAKVMHTLGRAGFVRSTRGAGGGFQFSGNERRITLLDIIELFEMLWSPGSDSEAVETTAEGRALGQVLGEIDDIARATLGSITLATMLKLTARHRNSGRRSTRRAAGSAVDTRLENG
jgi:Rrf2 family protein